ncbi:hypothetical protein MKX01_039459 [Papaver californicum]|nr:hypothetical protein MKX01_039459 [Papaver californicum]
MNDLMKDLEAGPDINNVETTGNPQMDPNFNEDILGKIQEAHEESKSLHKSDSLKAKAKIIRSRIEDLDRATVANRRLLGYASRTPLDRARTSVTNRLRQKLKALMMDFQDLRQKIIVEHKDTYPEEEVIEKIISNNAGEDFLQKTVQEHVKGKVFETVMEIVDRREAAKEVDFFLLVMVEARGDQIRYHAKNAGRYMKDVWLPCKNWIACGSGVSLMRGIVFFPFSLDSME